jgi:ribose transport system substrate-binding protein
LSIEVKEDARESQPAFKTYTTETVMAWNSERFDRWSTVGASTGALVLCAAAALSGCSKSETSTTASTDAGASAAASAAPAAAASDAGGGKVKVGFSVSTLNNAFFVGLKSGVEKGAKAQGFDLVQTNANGDAQQQVNDAINLLSQGVTALVLNPIDSKAIIPAVEKANAMGIPVFTLDRGSDGGKVTSFVASDNVALGATGAKWIADQLTKDWSVPRRPPIAKRASAMQSPSIRISRWSHARKARSTRRSRLTQ